MLTPAQRRIIAQKSQLKRLRNRLLFGVNQPKAKVVKSLIDWELPPASPRPRNRYSIPAELAQGGPTNAPR